MKLKNVKKEPVYKKIHEEIDPTPISVPAGFKRPETLAQQVARLTRASYAQMMQNSQEFDIPEEADDFGEEENDAMTPFEYQAELTDMRREIANHRAAMKEEAKLMSSETIRSKKVPLSRPASKPSKKKAKDAPEVDSDEE